MGSLMLILRVVDIQDEVLDRGEVIHGKHLAFFYS
jgi:hypothetical protein